MVNDINALFTETLENSFDRMHFGVAWVCVEKFGALP